MKVLPAVLLTATCVSPLLGCGEPNVAYEWTQVSTCNDGGELKAVTLHCYPPGTPDATAQARCDASGGAAPAGCSAWSCTVRMAYEGCTLDDEAP